MNEKEVAELRRRYHFEKHSITCLRGCYVNEKKEIISEFSQSLTLMPVDETEKYLSLFRRTLSGKLGRNLLDLSFSNQQVTDSEEHRTLMELRACGLRDDDIVHAFFCKIKDALTAEGNYLILLVHDVYDMPTRARDGQSLEDSVRSYEYVLCCVCPVKMTRAVLSYNAAVNTFQNGGADWAVGAPEVGFLFPTLDNHCTNIYNVLYYTRNLAESHGELIDALFRTVQPMPAKTQRDVFHSILGEALAEECSYDVVQTVDEQMRERIAEHQAMRDPEQLTVTKRDVKEVLEACGVSEERLGAFEKQYDAELGAATDLCPGNLVDTKRIELRTPGVIIRVNSDRGNFVETRTIDGLPYILIRADDGVEVNGVNICIPLGEKGE